VSRTSGEIFSCGSVREERESPSSSREGEEAQLSANTISCCSYTRTHIHKRTRAQINTLYNSLSPSFSTPSSSLSPAIPFFLACDRRLDVLFRFSCPPRLASRSRSVFLRCSKPRAGPAITRSRLTVAPCMAACFMLPASHCDAHRASELSPLLHFGRSAHAISSASAPRSLLMHGPRTCNTVAEPVAESWSPSIKYSMIK